MSWIHIKTHLNQIDFESHFCIRLWTMYSILMCIESSERNRYTSLVAGKTGFSTNIFPKTHRSITAQSSSKMSLPSLTSFHIDCIFIIITQMENKHHRQIVSMAVCRAPSLALCLSREHMFGEEICTTASKPDRYGSFMSSISLLLSFELWLSIVSLKVVCIIQSLICSAPCTL